MIDKNAIDSNALFYYRKLKKAGFYAYFVGGSVRDLLLGKAPKDFDIATNATPHQIKKTIPQGKIIGRRFRHVLLLKDGGRYEIVTFRGPVVKPEKAAVKDDENKESGRKSFPDLNQFGNAEQDAKRRDFTINALFYDPDVDELVDYVGGKVDIDKRLIRTIGEASVRMQEDPIRIIRAIRHKSKLNLDYDSSLSSAIQTTSEELNTTSKDRIREEFLKVCLDRSLGSFLDEAKKIGVINYLAPWFSEASEEDWQRGQKLWETFEQSKVEKNLPAELGIALMMWPLVPKVILEEFSGSQEINTEDINTLPDMKFFLNSEKMRNWLLRNLRISKVQTDSILRSFFYWVRFKYFWLEEGPPNRTAGKLKQHISAVLAAWMTKFTLEMEGKESPDWLNELANSLGQKYKAKNEDKEPKESKDGRENKKDSKTTREKKQNRNNRHNRNNDHEEEEVIALPVLEEPLVWNGPLFAPSLRPAFEEEDLTDKRWHRESLQQNQVLAYRPSGIPSKPVDKAIFYSNVVNNYKPEFPEKAENNEHKSANRERK